MKIKLWRQKKQRRKKKIIPAERDINKLGAKQKAVKKYPIVCLKKNTKKNKQMKQTPTITRLGVIHTLQQMNNPLTNIMLSIELLIAEKSEEKRIAYYDTIKHSAVRLEASIKEVCTFFNEQDADAAAEKEFIATKKL